MRCADKALYDVKMRGKNGCMAYSEGEQVKSRAKLGFVIKDIIDNLPGAFIVYRADKENDEILLANSEMLRLTGCKNMDELLAYTGKSFCNLIRPDEQESCQKAYGRRLTEDTQMIIFSFICKKQMAHIFQCSTMAG